MTAEEIVKIMEQNKISIHKVIQAAGYIVSGIYTESDILDYTKENKEKLSGIPDGIFLKSAIAAGMENSREHGFEKFMEETKDSILKGTHMSKAIETAKKYIDYLQTLNVEGVKSLFAEDIVQNVPFAPEGIPDRIEGKAAVSQAFDGLPMMFKNIFYSNLEFVETKEDDFAVVFAHADATLTSGDSYSQNYVFYIRVNSEGKIQNYREYMNPVQLGKALAAIGAK